MQNFGLKISKDVTEVCQLTCLDGVNKDSLVLHIYLSLHNLKAFSQNCEKLLLALSCLSVFVGQSVSNNSAPTRRIFTKFDTSLFLENPSRKFKFD